MDVNPLQALKAVLLTLVTELGISMEVKLKQERKA
jgi:hypothetical protein